VKRGSLGGEPFCKIPRRDSDPNWLEVPGDRA
jgi:hypothetical protein